MELGRGRYSTSIGPRTSKPLRPTSSGPNWFGTRPEQLHVRQLGPSLAAGRAHARSANCRRGHCSHAQAHRSSSKRTVGLWLAEGRRGRVYEASTVAAEAGNSPPSQWEGPHGPGAPGRRGDLLQDLLGPESERAVRPGLASQRHFSDRQS